MTTAKLFTPMKLGKYELKHRIIMAPLTRCRSDAAGIPNALMAEMYKQRATEGGLIVSEATPISREAQGCPNTPGCFTKEQVKGWKLTTDAVHAKGGLIFAQLWHMGRQSHTAFHPETGLPVSSSATPIKASSRCWIPSNEMVPYETPRALTTEEMPRLIADYVNSAKCALEAGFDGIEVHGANSYLIDQFLHDGINKRTDIYGGSIENRCRLLMEVTEAVIKVWGADRVGVRLSPPVWLKDSDKDALFLYAVAQLDKLDLAYLHLVDPMAYTRLLGFGMEMPEDMHLRAGFFRSTYHGCLIECGALDREMGIDLVEKGEADAIAYGVHFISNPDLVDRYINNYPIILADPAIYVNPGPHGYTDFPTYAEEMKAKENMAQGA